MDGRRGHRLKKQDEHSGIQAVEGHVRLHSVVFFLPGDWLILPRMDFAVKKGSDSGRVLQYLQNRQVGTPVRLPP